jgi:hypothetical protein
MSEQETDKAWKLKLRYGRLKTPYSHYTVLAEGIVGRLSEGFSCRPGPAWMGIKAWASSSGESADMIRAIGQQVGFTVTGRVHVYSTDPEQPPGENPLGYDITFTPFDPGAE